ncbi:hypothetical protein PWT90_09976 [Aphanocladium album]|nr:hypothetical protein PWT90_09976 [Aphanocladium album]
MKFDGVIALFVAAATAAPLLGDVTNTVTGLASNPGAAVAKVEDTANQGVGSTENVVNGLVGGVGKTVGGLLKPVMNTVGGLAGGLKK